MNISETFDDKTLISRVRQVREKHCGVRGKALFAKQLGISPSTYNYYENDRLPPIDVLWKICALTGADLHWLIGGEAKLANFSRDKQNNSLPQVLQEKLESLLAADPEALNVVINFIELLERKSRQEQELSRIRIQAGTKANGEISPAIAPPVDDRNQTSPAWVPVLGRTAAGIVHFWDENGGKLPGITELAALIEKHRENRQKQLALRDIHPEDPSTPAENLAASPIRLIQLSDLTEEGICEFVESESIRRRFPDAFALRVDGESMAPAIRPGDIVVLSPSVPARQGGTAVVQLDDQIGATCKIIRWEGDAVHLIPANEKYEPRIYPREKVTWALAVLWRIRV